MFNPDLTAGQLNSGHARFIASAQDKDEFYAVLDMTNAYADAASVQRGMQMTTEAYNALGDAMPYTAVTYTSSDEKIATVDTMGKITVVGPGTAVITATVHNGYKNVSGMVVLNCK